MTLFDAPAPRLGTPAGDAICWDVANTRVDHDDASRARALVDMGLLRVAEVARGAIRWWQPGYYRPRFTGDRDMCARLNRSMRDSRVFVMRELRPGIIPPPAAFLFVDVDGGGEWRTASGGAFGEDWISLGAFCWRTTRGKAAARMSRAVGAGRLPRVGDIR
jgi:hypothetical protein